MTNDATPRTTIGVLTSGLEDQYHTSILRGAIAAAQEHDANLIVYSGGELDSPVKDHINGNVIYDLATQATIDAILLFTGTLVGFVGLERQVEFAGRYLMPKVSIGINVANAHNVLLDNAFGMCAAIRHLVDVHSYRRIAFIQGPEGNTEAALRFQAYVDTLKDCGIPYDPLLVVSGKFQSEDGATAIQVLLDERKVTPDAIVAANDNMAIGALTELQKRHISAPGQIAVVGFDDIEDSEATNPPLTTVRQPLYEQGKCGVELALALLRNEEVANPLILQTELVIRRSCGCFSQTTLAIKSENAVSDNVSLDSIVAGLKSVNALNFVGDMPISTNLHYVEKLYKAFLEDLLGSPDPQSIGKFITTLDVFTRELLLERAQTHLWHDLLTAARREISPRLGNNTALRMRAENLWQQGRIVVSEAIQHAAANKLLQTNSQTKALNAIGEALLTVTNVADLAKVMPEGLPILGVKSCYIAIYEDPSRTSSQLIYFYNQHGQQADSSTESSYVPFPSTALIPHSLLPADKRYTLLVEGLHFDNVLLGYIVLEIEHAQAYIYEALRKHVSSALHTESIVQQLIEKQGLLETTLRELKTTQSMLVHSEKMNALGQMVAGVAHEINNPIAFVNSNVHSLHKTFEEMVGAYDSLEEFARGASNENTLVLDKIRQDADLDFLVDDTKDLIDQTLIGLKRVKDIVQELRKFSRLDEAEYKVSNLRENIESTLIVASGELRNRIATEVNIDPTLTLTCAPAELNQVFLNIIVNAAQAIVGEGKIVITAHENADDVLIDITDTGGGIPDNVVDHIFDPFFTTKPIGVGTGLGLAISHKIVVDGHKGSISVTSKIGSGTTFTIRLPKELQR